MKYTFRNPDIYHGDLWYTENDKQYIVSAKHTFQIHQYVGGAKRI